MKGEKGYSLQCALCVQLTCEHFESEQIWVECLLLIWTHLRLDKQLQWKWTNSEFHCQNHTFRLVMSLSTVSWKIQLHTISFVIGPFKLLEVVGFLSLLRTIVFQWNSLPSEFGLIAKGESNSHTACWVIAHFRRYFHIFIFDHFECITFSHSISNMSLLKWTSSLLFRFSLAHTESLRRPWWSVLFWDIHSLTELLCHSGSVSGDFILCQQFCKLSPMAL